MVTLTPEEVAARRQKLNEEAYFNAMNAFVSKQNQAVTLFARLRRELHISKEQHNLYKEKLLGGGPIQPVATAPEAAAVAGAGHGRPVRAVSSRDRSLSGQLQPQQSSRSKQNKRKAAEPVAQTQDDSGKGQMVGYKVNYFWDANRVWQEGVITRFQDNKICITFNMGTQAETHEWVKWEASDNFKMVMADPLDLTGYRPVRSQF